MEHRVDVAVVGAGIAGLTAAALLARAGLKVELLEAHSQSGGCAGTFRRGPYTFDVGATQVAGLEAGGIHSRLFAHLGVPAPEATPLDPGCVVDLGDGSAPIHLWRDPERWRLERQRQFPGSERFWQLCAAIHRANWHFAAKDPVLPARNWWDWGQLLGSLGPGNLASGLLTGATIANLQDLCGCGQDQRLRRFLDLQLKLYSQEPADRTAALYGATVLAMAQAPLGLFHLQGSMQSLCDALESALASGSGGGGGGVLRLRHQVGQLEAANAGQGWRVRGKVLAGKGLANGKATKTNLESFELEAADVVIAIPPQALPPLLGDGLKANYKQCLEGLGEPSGALVLYGAVDRSALPPDCASHLQLAWEEPGSLFVSISQEGDGRAPAGQATVIASVFTPAKQWFGLEPQAYAAKKAAAQLGINRGLSALLQLEPGDWRHQELATPRGFAGWTGRPWGYVGGLGQHPSRFGPFGLPSRTPLPGLWLCGDAIYPGEGTAGVSMSALTACRQLLQTRGIGLALER
ncbi:C-3',4' desaturase CrtD [Cyanobium sp. WAJ14-Wanaka]|uniref:C-3',4' desaturase CrtD n=1 Tax=Cyanobium sp. WAJ14-Wanaka TaxID=2823725 RepID=UPI0020CD0CFF|nr:C-3',4' desaturase CrtD [Cyanobium sp. WAJ14-Wanaka]MCP9776018.1 C-3',4' desaturase CrtD [Cyanobium sp. WAJ14-Wanaka]